MAVLFQMVNNSTADDAVNVAERFGRLAMVVSYHVEVVRHYDVSIDGKACRPSGFIESVTGYTFDNGGSKYRKAVFGYCGNVKSRIVA